MLFKTLKRLQRTYGSLALLLSNNLLMADISLNITLAFVKHYKISIPWKLERNILRAMLFKTLKRLQRTYGSLALLLSNNLLMADISLNITCKELKTARLLAKINSYLARCLLYVYSYANE